MELTAPFANASASALFRTRLTSVSRTKIICASSIKGNDPLLQSAINAASLRFQETHRPEPLFFDPYAGCFLSPNLEMDTKKQLHHYCVSTKFVDDKLLRTLNHMDGLKQVILLTDGMDTRPFRLNWPTSTIIFDISPERIFKRASEKLEGVGAKIPRSCLFLHVPMESPNIQEALYNKGFNGNRPSIWAIQGFPVMTLANFEEILVCASNLAMKGCTFLGELPAWLAETEIGVKPSMKKWIEKLFMSYGFRVDMVSCDEVSRSFGKELTSDSYSNILFVAEQLRYSDNQVEIWRREFQRVEEDGDEEGFEEL